MKLPKFKLLPCVFGAIVLGILCGLFFPLSLVRVFATFNALFTELLGFVVPLIIIGLVVPSIADLGKDAGKLLVLTALIAYASTLFSGFFTYLSCDLSFSAILPHGVLGSMVGEGNLPQVEPYFTLSFPPTMDVMSSLLFAFMLGLGIAFIKGTQLKAVMTDFKDIMEKVIHNCIVPLLPIYIFGVFTAMTSGGGIFHVLWIFLRVVGVIFVLQAVLLIIQFSIAGSVSGKSPWRLLKNMLPAYFTALGTCSSAATIPVTLDQTIKNGVREDVADFVIPLCATIHLSGSTMKIVSIAMAFMIMGDMPYDFMTFAGFIATLGLTMVAAPGVPGGAIVAAMGLLQSVLGFDEQLLALMVALYVAIDGFGTACNVTGDGAIAVIMDRIVGRQKETDNQPSLPS
jgi:Na+/H+-dicarboxylate symporter